MVAKRIFDFCAGLVGLVLLMPLLVICAIMVRVDSPGPALFTQQRVGKGQKLFKIYKFRTMVSGDGKEYPRLTIGKDSRITRVGLMLRKNKLDELPQLINIILGDMSLVGPRPEVPEYVAFWPVEKREEILSISPGITDLASIEFRDEASILEKSSNPEKSYIDDILPIKIEYYLRYVRERSFVMDILLILKTIFLLFRR